MCLEESSLHLPYFEFEDSYLKVQYKSQLKSSSPELLFVESFFLITDSIALLVINLKIFYFIMIQSW